MGELQVKKMKVVRVDKKEFELEDGRIYEHQVEFEEIPSLEDFQKTYDQWTNIFNNLDTEKEY
jgi:hypothetical protein